MDFWSKLLDTSDFPARWNCGNWSAFHGWLHIASDIGIWSAYFAIPAILALLLSRRPDLPFRPVSLLFVGFILLCGATHLMEAAIFYWPAYRLAGVLKFVTACVSWATVGALVVVGPKVLRMRTAEELEREIEARRAAEAALQDTNSKLEERVRARTVDYERTRGEMRQLANAMPQLVWMAQPDGRIDWYNRRWFEYTGTTLEDMQGWGWQSVHDPEVLPEVLESWKLSIKTGEPFEMVFPLRGADGEFRPFLTRVRPFHDETGRIVRWFGTNTDVSDQYAVQQELRSVAARLSEANRHKTEFLALLAHELRNPLAPLRSGLDLMKRGDLDPDRAGHVRESMDRQVSRLSGLVDDLLDVSRITLGKLRLAPTSVELVEVLDTAISENRLALEDAGHELTTRLPDPGVRVHGDPNRLVQVFSNLLSNAAKYTPPGGQVSIETDVDADSVLVTVADNGVGISESMQKRVFDLFAQGSDALDDTTGLGIGLTLVRTLVELHNGSITLHSDGPGRGTAFSVRLPVLEGAVEHSADVSGTPKSAVRRRVLVVDDNVEAADMLQMLIDMLGHEVEVAHDGLQAVRLAEEFGPDLVLMDVGMPNMDGCEAARCIRNQSWGTSMTLVALTGWGQQEDRDRTRDAGFDHHLVKPADVDQVEALLCE